MNWKDAILAERCVCLLRVWISVTPWQRILGLWPIILAHQKVVTTSVGVPLPFLHCLSDCFLLLSLLFSSSVSVSSHSGNRLSRLSLCRLLSTRKSVCVCVCVCTSGEIVWVLNFLPMAHWPEMLLLLLLLQLGDIPTFAPYFRSVLFSVSHCVWRMEPEKRAAIIGTPCEDMKRPHSLSHSIMAIIIIINVRFAFCLSSAVHSLFVLTFSRFDTNRIKSPVWST